MSRKRSKSIEVKFIPKMEYQDDQIYNCVDCGWNDYEFNKQPCTLCIQSGYGCQNYFDADEIE